MKKILQITFCILACLSVAASVLLGVFLGFAYCVIALAVAVLFAALMLFVKNGSLKPKEEPRVDFMNSEEENERLRRESENQDEE